MAKKKTKTNLGIIKAPNVVFGTLVHNAHATVVAEQGMVMLKVAGAGHPYFLPEGLVLGHEYFGEEVEVTIRNITDEVILELGEDDIYEEDMEKNSKLVPVDNWHEVKELFNECKIQAFTKNAKALSTFVAGLAMAGIGTWLHLRGDFPYPVVPVIGMVLGPILAIGFGLLPTIGLLKQLNTSVIWDGAGNWIDVETGETNLNDGAPVRVNEWVR